MAIFMESVSRVQQPLLRETQDKMYISGQGHSKVTFKPTYGDFFNANPSWSQYEVSPAATRYIHTNNLITANLISTTTGDQGLSFCSPTQEVGTGGFKLLNSFKSSNGNNYSTSHMSSNGTSYLYEFDSYGRTTRSIVLSSVSHISFKFLFENDTHMFLYGVLSALNLVSFSAGTTNYGVISVRKSDLAVNGLFNYIPIQIATTGSSNAGSVPQLNFLVEYDPLNKKAVLFSTTLNSYGTTGFTAYKLYTVMAESGAGSLITKSPTSSFAGVSSIGTSGTTSQRVGYDLSKSVSWGSKRTFFMTDETANTGDTVCPIYAITYDYDANISPVGNLAASIPREAYLGATVSGYYQHSLRIIERSTYFYVVMITNRSNRNIAAAGAGTAMFKSAKIHVFKGQYSDPTTLTKISTYSAKQNLLSGYLDISGDYTQMMLTYVDGIPDIVTFNEVSEAYELKTQMPYDIKTAMVDSMSRLWILDNSNNLHLQGPSVGYTVRVAFKDKDLKYTSGSMGSYIQVSCYNYLGDRVANNVTIQLEGGAASFSSNGTTSITVMTDASQDLDVPITITGNGYIRAIANMAL